MHMNPHGRDKGSVDNKVDRGMRISENKEEGWGGEPSCPTSQLESVSSCLRSHRWCRSCQNHLRGNKHRW